MDNIATLGQEFGCRVESFPVTCLGLPLGDKYLSKSKWDVVIERVESRLGDWFAIFLSRGGKLIHIHVVLQALPAYLMSLFIAPASVVKKLERIFRNFLWNDKDNNHKSHLVRWDGDLNG